LLLLGAQLLNLVTAECPNACSSHGRCGAYDMCLCYRNWMANDCSERICQFGLAHVDTPKGDLDASSGALSGPGSTVVTNSPMYPYGTQEQFPNMIDSDNNVLTNTGHYYMECSNKGICDRELGMCECFPGYEGSACQRASCPSGENGMCSGHGTCQSIKDIAKLDNNNIYELWDEHSTMGCVCDAGYYGPDCSLRECKYGIDPLYADDLISTPRVANWTYTAYAKSAATLSGNYSIIFYDVFGEDWETDPIQFDAGCDGVINALEGLPNDVIPNNSVLCLKDEDHVLFNNTADITVLFSFIIVFPSNPGKLQQIKINKYLDGPRPTLVTDETESTLGLHVHANGFSGEFVDYVPDLCEDVLVTLTYTAGEYRLVTANNQDAAKLKRCLGDADGSTTVANTASEVYNWDYGDSDNPHLIKLVEATAYPLSRICNSTTTYNAVMNSPDWCDNLQPAGFYTPLIFDGTNFVLYGKAADDYSTSTQFHVFTTTGRLNLINSNAEVYAIRPGYTDGVTQLHWVYEGNEAETIDCETSTNARDCLNKGHLAMFFDPTDSDSAAHPKYHNIYTIEKIFIDRNSTTYDDQANIVLDMDINFKTEPVGAGSGVLAYRFYPPTGYEYVSECSGRGLCNSEEAICECFPGYTSDDCSVQNTLAQ